jgi:anti-sigma-K factor RskA
VNDDRFTEQAPDYALGLLEGEELDEFERHLAAGCPECERELASMDAVGDALAYAVNAPPAPAALRDRVLAAIATDLERERAGASELASEAAAMSATATVPAGQPLYRGQPTATPTYEPSPAAWPARTSAPAAPSISWWMRLAPALAFAGVLAAGLLGSWAYRLDRQLALVRGDLERVQAENQALARIMDVVQSDRLRVVALAGQGDARAARGRVLWSPEKRQAVLYAFDLPRPPAGQDYQLWAIDDGTPRSEGVFPVDASGRATHVLPEAPAAGAVSAFAITLEPAGGMPQPTGPMVLLGPVGAHVEG